MLLSASIIIDSGTSSHVHSNCSHFTSLSSKSGKVSGFGDGMRKIEGQGKVSLHSKLPKGGTAHLRLQDACFVPNSSPTLISVSCLDEADCYTLFGDGQCISFEKKDHGKFI
jgi:hypothetical protein